ncbi:hypothetical protein [Pontibacter ramchanderi]|uniref:Uncharacterized protein n=1 Tax=Pontibacter ramchanderi TaxID=1179743 RepID=A0A2N3V0X5_9BACT|nr:hypothetical protein [Pontibacter ramchanderi]PKV75267.1 hypothetical protein BD749_0205 [Pontibacter ramchanderi]
MEKISYTPLIQHLQENGTLYNQLYRESELKYGSVDRAVLSRWMVQTVEPIVRAVDALYPDHLPQTFRTCYTYTLELLGNKSGIVHEEEYQAAWRLCEKVPSLAGLYPGRLLSAINAALDSIRAHQPERVMQWVAGMEVTLRYVPSLEEFLALGRIHAWLVGMAHLRERAQLEFAKLRDVLRQALQSSYPHLLVDNAFEQEWLDLPVPKFIYSPGGYVGYGGAFTAPPKVAQLGNQLLATDGEQPYAFFADAFGSVLLPEVPVQPKAILKRSNLQGLEAFFAKFGKQAIPFDDVISAVLLPTTLVLTRASSHHLFVYGWTR